MNSSDQNFILCGMYAFTEELRQAWTEVFANIGEFLPPSWGDELKVVFEDDFNLFTDENLLFGHTCGYPFVTRLRKSHALVAVPVFEVPGCQGTHYSSWIITQADSKRNSLQEFRGTRATINNRDSNSGMNVFRHEVQKLSKEEEFFESVSVNGSHITSMELIKNGDAEIAAIDAVTLQLSINQGLFNPSDFKIIQQTISTPGLPFVLSRDREQHGEMLRQAMNGALQRASTDATDILCLTGFQGIDEKDYEVIENIDSERAFH